MGFFKKKVSPKSLIDFTTTQFDNNSLLVNYSKNIGEKMVVPLSKVFDYGVVSLVTILIYNLINNKEFSYY